MLPLEDTFSDILGKALRGLKLADGVAAQKAGLTPEAVQALRDGTWDEAAARALAPVLGLNADALAASAHHSWTPAPVAVDGLAHFNTPFEDMTVNSYLAWDAASGKAVAFDTGADATAMLSLLEGKGLRLQFILLTHTHGDHIFDLDRLKSRTRVPAFVGNREPLEGAESFAPGRTFECGALRIETRSTWGHSSGGITYVVSGLARPVAIVGDSIFAGSMGGGGIDYQAAVRNNREQILTLTDDTILCPGHGPLTTLAEQKAHNPFFA